MCDAHPHLFPDWCCKVSIVLFRDHLGHQGQWDFWERLVLRWECGRMVYGNQVYANFTKEHTWQRCFLHYFYRVLQARWENQDCQASQARRWEISAFLIWLFIDIKFTIKFINAAMLMFLFVSSSGSHWCCWEHRRAGTNRAKGNFTFATISNKKVFFLSPRWSWLVSETLNMCGNRGSQAWREKQVKLVPMEPRWHDYFMECPNFVINKTHVPKFAFAFNQGDWNLYMLFFFVPMFRVTKATWVRKATKEKKVKLG